MRIRRRKAEKKPAVSDSIKYKIPHAAYIIVYAPILKLCPYILNILYFLQKKFH